MVVKLSQKYRGFTLLELLIVISIIGILVTVVAASYTSSQQKARNARRMSDLKAVQTAAEQFYANQTTPSYPATTDDFKAGANPVMPQGYPSDPKFTDAADNYTFTQPDGTTSTYCACAKLEPKDSATNGNSTDRTCAADTWSSGPYYCVKNLQ
jgi:type IV pilus assembly protein PilE